VLNKSLIIFVSLKKTFYPKKKGMDQTSDMAKNIEKTRDNCYITISDDDPSNPFSIYCDKSYLFIFIFHRLNESYDYKIPTEIMYFIIHKIRLITLGTYHPLHHYNISLGNVKRIVYCYSGRCLKPLFILSCNGQQILSFRARQCSYCNQISCMTCTSYCCDPEKYGYRGINLYLCNRCKENKNHMW